MFPRLLITGFQPNDDGVNASQILVESVAAALPESLEDRRGRIFTRILPADTHALGSAITKALDEFVPDITLLFGQAPGRSKLTFERIATNLRDFRVPDGAGNLESGTRIVQNGPAAYFSTLADSQFLADLLEEHGVPASPSNHAGNHLCNQALYQVLHYFAERKRPNASAGFVHVPLLPQQNIGRWSDYPTMSLPLMLAAFAYLVTALTKSEDT